MTSQELVAAVDIGSTKVCVLVAAYGEPPRIVGAGVAACEGLKKGAVVNPEKTVQAIAQAVEQAERACGAKITEAVVGIGGEHVKSGNTRSVVAVGRSDGMIRDGDVKRIYEAARGVVTSSERSLLHVIPQEFVVDGERGVKDPIGMSGVRLEGHFHVVTGAAGSVQSLVRCVRRAGLRVRETVVLPYASSFAVLRPDELERGVTLLDIGGGTTAMALFHGGAVQYTGVLAVGGAHITNDLVIGLRIPAQEAEEIKIRFGRAMAREGRTAIPIPVAGGDGGGDRSVSSEILGSIIEPRVEEMLTLAAEAVRGADGAYRAEGIGSGVVLTGGTSLLPGIAALAERVFEMPARVGWPTGANGLPESLEDPRYASAVGLTLYGIETDVKRRGGLASVGVESIGRAVGQVTDWIKDFF